MFLPLDRGIDWRNPPLATLVLGLISLLVFVLFQLDDAQEQRRSMSFYYESGLADIELPAYRDWLASRGRKAELRQRWGDELTEPRSPWYREALADGRFQRALERLEVIDTAHPDYVQWRRKRSDFERLLEADTSYHWGLIPTRLDWPNLISHQFLHGGPGHLIGNLVFLVAVGVLLEVAAGSVLTTLVYFAGGVAAALVFIAFYPYSGVPLIGASGAISALMGAMAVAYGLNRVRVFFALGPYLDYRRVPALLLLMPWFGIELLRHLWYGDTSGTAYAAHFGGVAAGALLMTPIRLLDRRIAERARPLPDGGPSAEALLEQAHDATTRMDLDDALTLYDRVLRLRPDDPRALHGVYQCRAVQPATAEYHASARQILELRGGHCSALVREVYRDYQMRARPRPQLRAATLDALAARFLAERDLNEAERLLRVMVRRPGTFPRLRHRLAELIRLLNEAGESERAGGWATKAKAVLGGRG